jgi:virginiamycin B lyase
MQSSKVRTLHATLAIACFALSCVAPGVAQAQGGPKVLNKFSAGGLGPLNIVTGSDGNLYASLSGGTATANGAAAGKPQFAQITPEGRVTNFGAGAFPGITPTALVPGPDGNVWFVDTGNNAIGRILVEGPFVEELVMFPSVMPSNLAAGPDNNVWFTESTGTMIGRITTSGAVTLFTEGVNAAAGIQRITRGPDGNVWFTEAGLNRIGSITPSGEILEYGSNISPSAGLFDIVAGPDGNIWFSESATGLIGRITPAGVVTEFQTGIDPKNAPLVLAAGPDGNIWFGEQTTSNSTGVAQGHNRFGKITTSGVVTEYLADLPGLDFPDSVTSITRGPGNSIWFTQSVTSQFSQVTLDPPSALAASILPGGRTVAPGAPATVFATMLNGGATALSNCQVGLPADAPLSLSVNYQATVPATNAPTGPLNTPFTLGAGAAQTLLLTFNSATPVFAPGLAVNFSCAGAAVAPTEGVNTADLYFSDLSVPDDIVLAATATPGLLNVPVEGSGAFSVAMLNVGGSTQGVPTQVSVDTGLSILPVVVNVCQTNAAGACQQPPAQTQFVNLPAGSAATFSVFVSAIGAVPFDPSNNRVFIRFIDFDETQAHLVMRGSSSVALTAQ